MQGVSELEKKRSLFGPYSVDEGLGPIHVPHRRVTGPEPLGGHTTAARGHLWRQRGEGEGRGAGLGSPGCGMGLI